MPVQVSLGLGGPEQLTTGLTTDSLGAALADAESAYTQRTPGSARLYSDATQLIPGGVSANLRYFSPHPLVMRRASGAMIWDTDDNPYVDYQLSYGALIVGHCHPSVRHAVIQQLETDGTSTFGAGHSREIELARAVCRHYRPRGQVRFTNSGLEATLLCTRLAVAFTGRTTIAKFEGHYHGAHDRVLVSVKPTLASAGPGDHPAAVPDSYGMPDAVLRETLVLPFNDWESTERLLRANAHRTAAVIAEPVQGGFIPPQNDFLRRLAGLVRELGMLLIFDEVKTGFRLGLGGAQARYDVEPDLTALGKILGGGYPIGAVVGRAEVMSRLDPSARPREEVVFHSGTYNGHPTIATAGLATIHELEQPGVYDRLDRMAAALKDYIGSSARRLGVELQVPGVGSTFGLVFTDLPIRSYRDVAAADHRRRRLLYLLLLSQGLYFIPGDRFSLSTAHGEHELELAARAFEHALRRVADSCS